MPAFSLALFAPWKSDSTLVAFRLQSTEGFDIDSTPPAMPTWDRPALMASCTDSMAVMLVMQLSVTVTDRTESGRRLEKLTSRARWGTRASTVTMP